MNRRDVVIFDLGNVLIDFDPRRVYREFYKGDEVALQHFFDSRAMWDIRMKQNNIPRLCING